MTKGVDQHVGFPGSEEKGAAANADLQQPLAYDFDHMFCMMYTVPNSRAADVSEVSWETDLLM
jgi:hypothetical protein